MQSNESTGLCFCIFHCVFCSACLLWHSFREPERCGGSGGCPHLQPTRGPTHCHLLADCQLHHTQQGRQVRYTRHSSPPIAISWQTASSTIHSKADRLDIPDTAAHHHCHLLADCQFHHTQQGRQVRYTRHSSPPSLPSHCRLLAPL
jgi:hypothetical protein